MKLYLCHGITFAGTQAEAKKLDKDFIPTEVPTDKESLISYLNNFGEMNRNTGRNGANEASQIDTPRPVFEIEHNTAALSDQPLSLTDVEGFIQDANHSQVASVFENVVQRSRELLQAPPATGSLQERMNAVAEAAGGKTVKTPAITPAEQDILDDKQRAIEDEGDADDLMS